MRCSVNWVHYGNILQMARKLFSTEKPFDFSVGPGIMNEHTFILMYKYVRAGYVTNTLSLEPFPNEKGIPEYLAMRDIIFEMMYAPLQDS